MSKVCISKEIFKETSLQLAIKAYSGIAVISFVENDENWLLDFSNCIYDIERTTNEFENFLICLEAKIGDNHGSM